MSSKQRVILSSQLPLPGDWKAAPKLQPSNFAPGVHTGFPSPAEDFQDRPLDLNDFLVPNPPATIFARVEGDALRGIGIFPGDIAIVDRSQRPAHDSPVVAVIEGEILIGRCLKQGEKYYVVSGDSRGRQVEVGPEKAEVVGVISSVIHYQL